MTKKRKMKFTRLDEDGEEITGHVFVSPNLAAHWPALDAFEGEDYVRELTRAILADATEVEACMYALAEAKRPRSSERSLGGPSRTT
ncbi:MAG: gamma-glutamylcyclotransferase, partial [Thauera sp.]